MKIKIDSGTPEVAIAGLGLVKTNDWQEITKEQEEAFERIHNKTVGEVFNVKKETKPKKEAS